MASVRGLEVEEKEVRELKESKVKAMGSEKLKVPVSSPVDLHHVAHCDS